ncbi:MAG: S9 family peptidase [Gemmatimonadetes bacterium]|nr:S9 family peptidase [Gemmatimonadota bacterium]
MGHWLLGLLQVVPLTIENIQTRGRGAFEAVLSPDGATVAVVAAAAEGRGVFRVPSLGGPPIHWADGAGPAWFPDSRSIVVSRGGDLWRVDWTGAATRLTTDSLDERAAAVSPDGRWVAFYSERSGWQDIWIVPADGGTPRRLTDRAMPADDPRFIPAWSPDSRSIAYVSNRAGYWSDDLWVVDVPSGRSRQLSRRLMASTTPTWSSDGTRLALLATQKAGYWYEDLADLVVIDVRTAVERVVPMQVHGSDWLHSQRVGWSDGDRRLLFPYLERGDFHVWSVDARGGVATRVSHHGGAFRPLSFSAKGDRVVYVRSTETDGPDVFLLDLIGGSPRRLTAFADQWADAQTPEEIAFRSHDGMYIQGFLYRPKEFDSTRRYPAVVQVHGGGTNSYLRGRNLLEQYLASRGYLVLAVNYRGGSGFGRAFQDLAINDWANGQARDAAAAAGFLRTLPYVNGKVGIYGYSYGGITTMAAIAREPGVFDAAVPMAGIYDFGDAYGNADRLGRIFIRTGHGGDPATRRATYAVSNTLARIRHVTTPVLIIHGEADVRAPYRQYQMAVDTLRILGKVFEAKSYPGEPHGFRSAANRIDMYQRLERFLDRYLRGGEAG